MKSLGEKIYAMKKKKKPHQQICLFSCLYSVYYNDRWCCRDRELLRYDSTDSETDSDVSSESEINSEQIFGTLKTHGECLINQQPLSNLTSNPPAEPVVDEALTFFTEELDCGVTLDEILSEVTLEDSIADGTHCELLLIEKTPQADLDKRKKSRPSQQVQFHSETVKKQICQTLNNSERGLHVKSQVLSGKAESEDDTESSDESGLDEETAAELELMRQFGLPVALGSPQKPQVCTCIWTAGSTC